MQRGGKEGRRQESRKCRDGRKVEKFRDAAGKHGGKDGEKKEGGGFKGRSKGWNNEKVVGRGKDRHSKGVSKQGGEQGRENNNKEKGKGEMKGGQGCDRSIGKNESKEKGKD